MRPSIIRRLAVVAAVVAAAAAVHFVHGRPAQAQIKGGVFELERLDSSSKVAWCYRSADGTTEWWAYIHGQYRWADETATENDKWGIKGVYTGSASYSTYAEWRDYVLGLDETQGQSVIFQQMTVYEETILND